MEFLRQITLFKMQRDLWRIYELEWQKFKTKDHLIAKAPIPPSCRVLTLHLYLNETEKSISDIRSLAELAIEFQMFSKFYKEAKRRLQMCSFRILDKQMLVEMKNELSDGFERLMATAGNPFNMAPQYAQREPEPPKATEGRVTRLAAKLTDAHRTSLASEVRHQSLCLEASNATVGRAAEDKSSCDVDNSKYEATPNILVERFAATPAASQTLVKTDSI